MEKKESDIPSQFIIPSEKDGRIILTFLDNDCKVRGDFYPHMSGGSPISPEYIASLLKQHNIVYGINQEGIDFAYKKCVDEGEIVKDVLIACGEVPVDERPEFMQLNPFLGKAYQKEKHDGSVDYREQSPFIIVRKDQALAKLKHAKTGKEGMNVHGEVLGYKSVQVKVVSGGANTHFKDRYLLSSINGQFINAKGVLSVSDSLVIKGPVGYATGHIVFPGDVTIEGPVSDGFKIHSGGSINIKQTFDVTDAVAKQDINVAGGIIGKGDAKIKAGGTIKTKFIENCRVACRNNIFVDLEIINSHIFTLETLEMGQKGRIVGGEIYALKGVRSAGIGKETGKAARIHCGVDFAQQQEKEKYNNIMKTLAIKLNRLRDLMKESQEDKTKLAKMEILLHRLEEEQSKAQSKVTELMAVQNSWWDAVVEVSGEIVRGTLIEICQVALFVAEPLKKVRIRLDRQNSRLITEGL